MRKTEMSADERSRCGWIYRIGKGPQGQKDAEERGREACIGIVERGEESSA